MATVYPTAAGNWSTRTWNNDATGSAYGGPPLAGDVVLANNLAITINQDVTVTELRTTAGTTAAAGGNFTTTVGRVVNANTQAGTTACLNLANLSTQNGNSKGGSVGSAHGTVATNNSTQNGNSFGSDTSAAQGTQASLGSVHNGNSFGGAGSNSIGTYCINGASQTGNSTGGSGTGANGTLCQNGGVHYGASTGGTATGAYGSRANNGGQVVSTGIPDSTAKGLRLENGGVVVLFGGVLESQIDNAATAFRIGNEGREYINDPDLIGTGGLAIGRLISGGV